MTNNLKFFGEGYIYKTVSADIVPGDEEAVANVQDLLNRLNKGWTIVAATGVAGGIHYILKSPLLEPQVGSNG